MNFKTCVSIAEKTPKKTLSQVKLGLQKSDYVEIRFDFLRPSDVPLVLNGVRRDLKRIVCTLRPKSEGGKFSGKENERVAILKLISEYCPFLLDVEHNTLKKNKHLVDYLKKSKTNILVSWHDFQKTPEPNILLKKLGEMKKFSDYVKIVTTAKKVDDAAKILSLYAKKSKVKLIAFTMGEEGKISRILCLFLGSPYTYASLGKAVAPGQISISELKPILS